MITCSVLRCTNAGSAFLVGNQNLVAGYHEAFVCAEHKALIEAGSPWGMEERYVLLGRDMAPVLQTWSARPSAGSEGFTLTLEIANQAKPIEVFLTSSEARMLAQFISAANGDGS
jgi:hypothetical protein